MSPATIKSKFLASAIAVDGCFLKNADFDAWFKSRQQAHRFVIEPIAFSGLEQWHFDDETGNIVHDSGKFFSIEGLDVTLDRGPVTTWQQPVINQPEIGFLGIVAKEFDGLLYFLMQVKMEPGNINMVQLSPTLQATRSNFTCVHRGKTPNYLEYFQNKTDVQVLVDSLQSEQGSRFWRKRNRNIIVLARGDIEAKDDFCWLTLGQIQSLLNRDNIVNMDARTVISCIQYPDAVEVRQSGFAAKVARSLSAEGPSIRTNLELRSWLTEEKFNREMTVKTIPLNQVKNWIKTDTEICHQDGRHFSVMACRIEADTREVLRWTQPLVKAAEPGIIALICQEICGNLHFLMQAKVEPGIFDTVEIAPTVQCMPSSYSHLPKESQPVFLDRVLNASQDQIRFDSMQSEEGGRFYREENRNVIIEVGDDFVTEVPDDFAWMTLRQLKEFVKYNNFLNVQCRCLLAGLGLC